MANKTNFLDLDEKDSPVESSKVVIFPVPYEKTVSFVKGTSKGPNAIIYASTSLEHYDDELGFEPSRVGIHTLEQTEYNISPEDMVKKVCKKADELIKKGKFVITLGGEHSITIGTIKGFKKNFDNFSVLSIDAHCDLRDSYEELKLSHACVMRRVVDENIHVVEVGIRSYSTEEADFIKQTDQVKVFHAIDILNQPNRSWIDQVVESLKPKVYISFDVDGLDTAIMPSTGTPEPGGLSWYDSISLLKKVFSEREVIGMDIVEFAPNPGNLAPDVLAAKLAYKSIGYKFYKDIN